MGWGARLRLTGAIACAMVAWAGFTDRLGLEASYHPLSPDFEKPAAYRRVDQTLAIEPHQVHAFFTNPSFFGIRWRGWVRAETDGIHTFRITTSDPASLRIAEEEILRVPGRAPRADSDTRTRSARVRLTRGVHPIEIELSHSAESIRFATEWKPPGKPRGPISPRLLFPHRPGPVAGAVRAGFGGLNPAARRAAATTFLIGAALLAWVTLRRREPGTWRARIRAWAAAPRRRRWLETGGLAGLFFLVVAWVYPRTGSPYGYDDVRYLDIAAFNRQVAWVANRYAHVYLLKPFFWLTGGDAFAAARLFWSAQLGLIVVCMAAATRVLAPHRRMFTLAAAVFLLLCQPLFFLRAGGAVPDFTVGTLLMLAVVIYLHRQTRSEAPGWEWHFFLIGLLTVWAVKSKELGVILLWLGAALPFENGALHWRGVPRKATGWLGGLAAGFLLLAVCDGLMLGDPLFGLRPSHQAEVAALNFAEAPQQTRDSDGWMQVVWRGKSPVTSDDRGFKYLALAVVFSALLAALARRPVEIRLLHLLPVLYLTMLIVIHIRATYVFLMRYLYPVIPLSCLLAAAGFYYLGLDRLRWREVVRPRFFVPAICLGFVLFGVVLPYRAQRLAPADFLPSEWLAATDWTSLDSFAHLVAGPLLVLALISALVFFARDVPLRLLAVTGLVVLAFGGSLLRATWELKARHAWQRAESYLYPWRTFAGEFDRDSALNVVVSPSLPGANRFFGVYETLERIGRLSLDRSYANIRLRNRLTRQHDYAFLHPENYRYWSDQWPALTETAIEGPHGRLVLVRPAEAKLGADGVPVATANGR